MRDILPNIGSAALLFLFLFCSQTHAQFSVTGTTPAANALDVAVNSDITITFSADVDGNTVSSSTIVIRSEQEGAVAGSFTVNSNTVTFNPTDNFRNGDRIYTTVTTGVTNTSAAALDSAYTFSFNTDVQSSSEIPPVFADITVSTNANGVGSVKAADLDGDGDLDLAATLQTDDTIAWYENTDGTGTFGGQQVVSTAADGANSVIAADLDGDGDLDLASASSNDNKIAWYQNDGTGNFGTQQVVVDTADGASSVIAADLDGDGDLDLASASKDDNKIAWYKNTDGNGTYGVQQEVIEAADAARQVIAADLDGDGDLDLASASSADDTIAWYENTDGVGNFGIQQIVSTSADGANSVLASDLDGDGDLDLASASHLDDTIAWYENTDENGSFGSEQIVSNATNGGLSVTAGDLDGDGDQDLALTSPGEGIIAWFTNDGTGSFGTQQQTPAEGSETLTAADFDNDGDLDLASASLRDNTITWHVNSTFFHITSFNPDRNELNVSTDASVLIGFDEAVNGTTLNNSNIVVTGAQSGLMDGSFSGGGTSSVLFDPSDNFKPGEIITVTITTSLLSTGNKLLENPETYQFTVQNAPSPESPPVFTEATVSDITDEALSVIAGDLDGDGDLDLASASYLDDTIGWYQNIGGTGSFGSQQTVSTTADGAGSVIATDIDGDGDLDLASASELDDTIAWYENTDGNGNFGSSQVVVDTATGARSVTAADFDGDGDLDLASANDASGDVVVWYENTDGTGNFGNAQSVFTATNGAHVLTKGDLDGDGDMDLISASVASGDDTIAWYENTDGAGTFGGQQEIDTDIDAAWSVAAADLDGDGDLDLLASASTLVSTSTGTNRVNAILWYENTDGTGTIWNTQLVDSDPNGVLMVASADIDGDGDQDLVGFLDDAGTMLWYENTDGVGNFGSGQIVDDSTTGISSIVPADIDGDDDLDLVSTSETDNKIDWHENTDTTPPDIISNQEFTIPEASGVGSPLGTVQATDSSSLGNWTIAGGNTDKDTDTNPPFAIDSNSGELSVNDADDITFDSGAQLYDLSITVQDSDGNTSSATPVSVLVEAVDVQIAGTAGFDGWRFLGTPSTGQAYNSLLSGVWTQGATGASTTDGTANVMQWDESAQQFVAVTDLTQTIPNGTGFIAYLYEDDDPGAAGVDGGWPKTLDASGSVATGTVNFPVSYSNGSDPSLDGFNLVANPYAVSIDWEQAGWTKTNINDAIYIWDPNANSGNGAYKQRVGGVGDDINVIAPFQAFWVQASTNNPVLSVSEEAKVDGGTFLREAEDPEASGGTGVLALKVSTEDFQDKMYVSFRPGGKLEQDSLDAFQLASLAGRFLELYSHGPDGTPFAIQSLPRELEKITELPVAVHTTESDGATLSWGRPEQVPEGWHFSLKDRKTGQIVVLNEPGNYSFELSMSPALSKESAGLQSNSNRFDARLKTAGSADGNSSENARFLLRINPGLGGFADGSTIPEKTELAQNYPNPFNPETVIRYGVPEGFEGRVELTIYNLLGRKVATLVDGQKSPGRYEVPFDASRLASGMYIYRLQVGSNVVTRKMMVIK